MGCDVHEQQFGGGERQDRIRRPGASRQRLGKEMTKHIQNLAAPPQRGHDEVTIKTPIARFERRRFGTIERFIERAAMPKDVDQDAQGGLPRR